MFNVYKIINNISTKELEGYSLDDVARLFKNSTDEKFKNKCFAYVFKNVYPMLLKIYNKPRFGYIQYDDKTEECLVAVLYALEHWDEKRGYKLSTYIYSKVNCSLISLETLYNSNKNKVFQNITYLEQDKTIYDHILNSIKYNSSEKLFNYIKDLDESSILNKDEIEYCKGILKGYTTNKQLSDYLNKKDITIYNKRTKKFITKQATEGNSLRYCQKLRSSIQTKLKKNNFSPF